jgi:hypothetical protein
MATRLRATNAAWWTDDPPDSLLTTPESLEVILVSSKIEHREFFTRVQIVVMDELHAFAGDDRGWPHQARRKQLPVPEFSPPRPLVSANFALRLLQIHLCIIYAASGLSKLQGPAWWSGVAVWGTMANYEFSPMRLQIYNAFLQFVCQHRWLWELVTTGGSYFTLAFEIGFGVLIWTRLRSTMVVAAVLLHTGIALFMGLVTFSLMMMVAVLAFIPGTLVREFIERLSHRSQDLPLTSRLVHSLHAESA